MATMDELQMRVEVQDAIVGMAMNLMGQNNVPPHMVMDGLIKAEARVSEYVMIEMVNASVEQQNQPQDIQVPPIEFDEESDE